jgi:hypothetical protein
MSEVEPDKKIQDGSNVGLDTTVASRVTYGTARYVKECWKSVPMFPCCCFVAGRYYAVLLMIFQTRLPLVHPSRCQPQVIWSRAVPFLAIATKHCM